MYSDIDGLVHLKLEGEIAELLVKVDPTYAEFVSKEKGKTVIYTELSKALYGTLQAALLFWQNLSDFLIKECGFVVNPYDWCMVNKDINVLILTATPLTVIRRLCLPSSNPSHCHTK